MEAAEVFVVSLAAYASIGILFSVIFLSVGIGCVDPGAAESGLGFRLVILPGVVSLWPLLLLRWTKRRRRR
jgi:hypothetical protein